MVSEPLEEIYIDPVIEAYVSQAVDKIGWDANAQILLSGLAESGREGLSGGISVLTNIGADTDTQLDIQIDQELVSDMSFEEQIAIAQEAKIKEQNRQDYITESLSTILMFTGALTGGIFGSVGTGFGTMLLGLGCSVESIDSLKDMYKSVLQKQQIQTPNSYLTDRISDSLWEYATINDIVQEDLSEAIKWAQLDQPQKQKQVKYIPSVMEDYWSMPVSISGNRLCGPYLYFDEKNDDNLRPTIIKEEENEQKREPKEHKAQLDISELLKKIVFEQDYQLIDKLVSLLNFRVNPQNPNTLNIETANEFLYGDPVFLKILQKFDKSLSVLPDFSEETQAKFSKYMFNSIDQAIPSDYPYEQKLRDFLYNRMKRSLASESQFREDMVKGFITRAKKFDVIIEKYSDTLKLSPINDESLLNFMEFIEELVSKSITENHPSAPEIEILLRQRAKKYLNNLRAPGKILIDTLCESYGCSISELKSKFKNSLRDEFDKLFNPDETVSFNFLAEIYRRAGKDRLILNSKKLASIFRAISDYNPIFSIFKSTGNIKFSVSIVKLLEYLETTEQIFEQQFKILNGDYIDGDPNEYIKLPNANWENPQIRQIQTELLLKIWDNRDALTGKEFDPGEPVHRHHYRILYIRGGQIEFIKYDCRLQAQVPLTAASHAAVANLRDARDFENKFTEAMEAWFNGEWYLPDWFNNPSDTKAFADHLRSLGFTENK